MQVLLIFVKVMFDFVQMCIFGRVGSCLPEVFSVACRDRFFNRIPFKSQTEIEMKLSSGGRAISSECSYDQYITHDSYTMKFKVPASCPLQYT